MQKDLRLDLQVLRGLAVAAVVIYHFYPDWLPTGLLGVDVFFVLSGYLITGLLWRDLAKAEGLKAITTQLTRFWARRARRLIPAALLVLVVTAVIGYFVAPRAWWLDVNAGWIWAVSYVANWFLANEAADYLRADAPVSPYQHYWSLSVEEQFYIVLPILLGLALLFTLRKRFGITFLLLAAISIGSLAHAFYMQTTDPAYGFYSSLTRFWEFGAGGLLALAQTKGYLNHLNPKLFSWTWLGLMVVMVVPHDPHFLVWHNLVAVALSVLAIVLSRGRFDSLRFKPVTLLGDYSYSIYLWHWPILVLSPWFLGFSALSAPIWIQALTLLLVVVVAVASKHLIEDPIRFGPFAQLRSGLQVLVTLLLSAALIASSLAFNHKAQAEADANAATFTFTPLLSKLEDDKSEAEDGLHIIRRDQDGFKVAEFGDRGSAVRIALVGDSHARQYWTPLNELANKYGFGLDMISKSACSVQNPENYQLAPFGGGLYCKEWNQQLQDYLLAADYDLIVNSNSTLVHDGQLAPAQSFVEALQGWVAAGHNVLLIRDNAKPNVADAVSDFRFCIEQFGDAAATECSTPMDRAMDPNDKLFELGVEVPGVSGLDLTPVLCPDGETCPVIMDGVIVYRDGSHMTNTFTRTLVDEFEAKLKEVGIL
ncbi:MAG: hypothetical protein RL068_534 [Actinomycetota bacterium]